MKINFTGSGKTLLLITIGVVMSIAVIDIVYVLRGALLPYSYIVAFIGSVAIIIAVLKEPHEIQGNKK